MEERRGNARRSKMSKIHTLGLSVFSTHKQRRGEKTNFNINRRQAGSVSLCVIFFFFLILASCKYPAKALRRVLLGSQDVNNFLPVAKETLPLKHRAPGSLPHGHRTFSQRRPSLSRPRSCAIRCTGTSGCFMDQETPNIWGLYRFPLGEVDVSLVSHLKAAT